MVQTNESAIELRCCTILNYLFMNRLFGLFHKKIHSLWNRPKSLLSENGARCAIERINLMLVLIAIRAGKMPTPHTRYQFDITLEFSIPPGEFESPSHP